MKILIHTWQKCIANGGDYVEKKICSWKLALSNIVIVISVFVVVSV